jgi:tripartite-type tricarboxylate transporter receptor subunit TctC
MAEAGYPAVETGSTNAVFVPAATPLAIRQKLNAEISKILQKPEVLDRLTRQGSNPAMRSLEEADKFVRSELARWEEMIRGAGLEKQ